MMPVHNLHTDRLVKLFTMTSCHILTFTLQYKFNVMLFLPIFWPFTIIPYSWISPSALCSISPTGVQTLHKDLLLFLSSTRYMGFCNFRASVAVKQYTQQLDKGDTEDCRRFEKSGMNVGLRTHYFNWLLAL